MNQMMICRSNWTYNSGNLLLFNLLIIIREHSPSSECFLYQAISKPLSPHFESPVANLN